MGKPVLNAYTTSYSQLSYCRTVAVRTSVKTAVFPLSIKVLLLCTFLYTINLTSLSFSVFSMVFFKIPHFYSRGASL